MHIKIKGIKKAAVGAAFMRELHITFRKYW